MFRRFFLTGALCICAIVILGNVAQAGCDPDTEVFQCKYIGGRRCCGCFEKGSTICETFLQKYNQFCPDPPCEAICDLYGVEAAGRCYGTCETIENPGGDPSWTVTTLTGDGCFDEDCDFLVYALCGPKKCDDPTASGCWENVSLQSVHFGGNQLPPAIVELSDCPNGNCRTLTEILGEDSDIKVCPKGLKLFEAFLGRFNAKVCFCPGEYVAGRCEPRAGTDEEEVCVEAFHEIDPDAETGESYLSNAPVNVPYSPTE